jgi:hypothetical protein
MHTLLVIGICVLVTLLELAVVLVVCAPRWCWQHLRALLRRLVPRPSRWQALGGQRPSRAGPGPG